MASALDGIVQAVTAAHPSCGHLAELLELHGDTPDVEQKLERLLLATDRSLIVRLHRAFSLTLPSPISFDRAIQEVGIRPVHSAATATTIIRELRDDPVQTLNATTFWRNAVAVGVLSLLTATTDGVHYDEAFAAGFAHRLGLLFLGQHAPDAFARAAARTERDGMAIDDAVLAECGFSPAELAGAVAVRWQLPDWFTNACAYPATSDEVLGQPRELASVIQRARLAAAVRGFAEQFTMPELAESRMMWIAERPLLALDRIGGASWLATRVEALLSVALLDR